MNANPVVGILGYCIALGLSLFYAQSAHQGTGLLSFAAIFLATWLLEAQAVRRRPVDFAGGFCFCLILGLGGDAPGAILLLMSSAFLRQLKPGITYPWDLAWTVPSLILLLALQEFYDWNQTKIRIVGGLASLLLAALLFTFASRRSERKKPESPKNFQCSLIEKEQRRLRLLILPFTALAFLLPQEMLGVSCLALPLLLAIQSGVGNTGFRVRAQSAEFAVKEARQSQQQLERTQDRLHTVSKKQQLLEDLVEVFDQALTPAEAFEELISATQTTVPYRSLVLFRLTENYRLEPFRYRSPETDLREKSSLTLKKEPLVEKAWQQDRPFRGRAGNDRSDRLLAAESDLVAIPLKPFGVLYFGRSEQGQFSKAEAKKLLFIVNRAEAALIRAEETLRSKQALEEETQRSDVLQKRVALSSRLLEASQKVMLTKSSGQVVDVLRAALLAAFPQSSGTLTLHALGERRLNWGPGDMEDTLVDELQHSVQQNLRSVYIANLSQSRLAAPENKMESILAAPLLTGNQYMGFLTLASEQSDRFDTEAQDYVSTLACLGGGGLESLRLNQDLQRAHEQVVQTSKLSAIGQLAAGVAHELNTPLAAIRLAVESALLRPERAADKLTTAEKAMDRAQEIVDGLLEHSRQKNSDRELCHLDDILEEVQLSAQAKLKGRTQKLLVMQDEPELKVYASKNEIHQILNNLVANASDASPDAAEITIKTCAQEDRVKIEIVDQGAGIEESIQNRVFEPFFTTKAVGQGTGLGLSVCRELVQRHHGTLEFKSSPKRGTTFTLTFPSRNSDRASILN